MSIDVNVQNDLVIVTESSEDITVNVSNARGADGVGVPVGGTTGQVLKKFTNTNYDTYWAADASGLTSVGLSMPSAFSVSNSPLTSNGTIAVTGAGTASQYIRGDGQLANFPSNGGGGSSVNYYLNGSVTQGTFGGSTYYEMSKTPILGAGTNFTRTNAQGNGYIASFITDAGDPSLLNIPSGNWTLEFYFQSSSTGGSPQFYGELYKVSSADVFTLVASGSTNPERITNGTTVDQYFTSIPVPQTSLLVTDRLAIRIYVITSDKTITLHTENGNLCEILTTFSTGLNALNGLTSQVQYFATGTSGTDFAISSATETHTFNLPTASATNRGALSSADWSTFSGKVGGSGTSGQVAYWNGTGSVTGSTALTYTDSTGAMTLTKNQNAATGLYIKNTNGLSASSVLINLEGEISSSQTILGRYSSNNTGYLSMKNGDSYFFHNSDFGNTGIVFQTGGSAGGSIRFAVNNSATPQMTFTNAGRLLIGTTTEGTSQLQVADTSSFGTNDFTSKFNAKFGTFGIQSYALNNGFLADNIFFNGSTWTRTSNGYGYAFQFYNGQVIFNGVNTGSGNFTPNNTMKVDYAGNFLLGQSLSATPLNFTGATLRFTNNGRLLLGTTTESTYLLDVNGTARVSGTLTLTPTPSDNAIVINNGGYIKYGTTVYVRGSATSYNVLDSGYNSKFVLTWGGASSFFLTGGNYIFNGTTANASAMVQIDSTSQGFLPPRGTNAQMLAIASPATGLMFYDTTNNKLNCYDGTTWQACW